MGGTSILMRDEPGRDHDIAPNCNGAYFAIAGRLTGFAGPDRATCFSFAGGKTGPTRRVVPAATVAVLGGTTGIPWWRDFYGYNTPAIYTLDSGSSTVWQPHVTGINNMHYVPWVGMARNDASVMWAAGMDPNENPVMYRSTDAGAHWTSVLTTTNNGNAATGWAGQGGDRGWSYGGNPTGFSVAPTDATKAAFTDYGFCHLTTDGGVSWRQAYVNPADQNPAGANTPPGKKLPQRGARNTTCWQVLFPTSTRLILGNSDIRGSKSDDGGNSWNFNYTGHSDNSMYRLVKHSNGTLYAATATVHDLYQSTYLSDSRIEVSVGTPTRGKVIMSTDNGASWTLLHNFNRPVIWVATDPTNANRLYAAVIHWNGGSSRRAASTAPTISIKEPPATWTEMRPTAANGGASLQHRGVERRRRRGDVQRAAHFRLHGEQRRVLQHQPGRNVGGSHAGEHAVLDQRHRDRSARRHAEHLVRLLLQHLDTANNDRGGLYRTTNRGQNWTQVFSPANVPSGLPERGVVDGASRDSGHRLPDHGNGGALVHQQPRCGDAHWEMVPGFLFRQPTRVFFDPADTGKIWVTSFGHGLSTGMTLVAVWKEQQFGAQSSNPAVAGDLADPDGDGLNNLIEFSQHLNPLVADAKFLTPGGNAGLPVFANSGGWRFDFVRRTAASGPGVTYVAESSTDLLNWQALVAARR
jgi:hypothetical protein